MQLIWWRVEPTLGWCRSCWATRALLLHKYIRISIARMCDLNTLWRIHGLGRSSSAGSVTEPSQFLHNLFLLSRSCHLHACAPNHARPTTSCAWGVRFLSVGKKLKEGKGGGKCGKVYYVLTHSKHIECPRGEGLYTTIVA